MSGSTPRSLKKSLQSCRHVSSLATQYSSSSTSDNESYELLPRLNKSKKTDQFSFLDQLRQTTQSEASRFHISVQLQSGLAFLILAVACYFILEPVLPSKLALIRFAHENGTEAAKMSTFNLRMGYVLQNSCFSLLWVVFLELYKEYLRILTDVRNNRQNEISLSEQIRLNSRIKLAERLHLRSLSQFVLLLACQLSCASDHKLARVLHRVVPVFNALYLVARLLDFYQPKRLKMLAFFIVYMPVVFCILFNAKRQLHKTLRAWLLD